MLPDKSLWTCEYELSLDLHSAAGAKAQYCVVGNFEAMKSHCDAVLSQMNCPFIDKIQVYNTLLLSKGAQGHFQEAQDLCVKVRVGQALLALSIVWAERLLIQLEGLSEQSYP